MDLIHFQTVSNLDKFCVNHLEFQQAFSGIQRCMNKSLFYREAVGSLLLGDGGMGKTSVCNAIMKSMPSYVDKTDRYEKTIIPAFYASIPSPATIKSVAGCLLTQLNDPAPYIGTADSLTKRLSNLLTLCETKLVFLDEMHHLFNISNSLQSVNKNVRDWIKTLTKNTHISFCLVGLKEFEPIVTSDLELGRRFLNKFYLNPLLPGTEQQQGSLNLFLGEIDQQMLKRTGVASKPALNNHLLTLQIYAATQGNPAFIMSLIKETLLMCLESGDKVLTRQYLGEAWQTGMTSKTNLTPTNPFEMREGELAKYIRGIA